MSFDGNFQLKIISKTLVNEAISDLFLKIFSAFKLIGIGIGSGLSIHQIIGSSEPWCIDPSLMKITDSQFHVQIVHTTNHAYKYL